SMWYLCGLQPCMRAVPSRKKFMPSDFSALSVDLQSNRLHQRTPARDVGLDQPPECFGIRFKVGLEARFDQHALEALLRKRASRSRENLLDDGARRAGWC